LRKDCNTREAARTYFNSNTLQSGFSQITKLDYLERYVDPDSIAEKEKLKEEYPDIIMRLSKYFGRMSNISYICNLSTESVTRPP
jgi:hypothetical protein